MKHVYRKLSAAASVALRMRNGVPPPALSPAQGRNVL